MSPGLHVIAVQKGACTLLCGFARVIISRWLLLLLMLLLAGTPHHPSSVACVAMVLHWPPDYGLRRRQLRLCLCSCLNFIPPAEKPVLCGTARLAAAVGLDLAVAAVVGEAMPSVCWLVGWSLVGR